MIDVSSTHEVLVENEFDLSDELKQYFSNKFSLSDKKESILVEEESFIKDWERYFADAKANGTFKVLRQCYPQLNFPIENEINKTQDYINAVLKGKVEGLESNLGLNNPAGIELEIHDGFAGRIPVIKVTDSQDFTKIIQCFIHKNNPVNVPKSMGALLANGLNNWDRIHTLRNKWLANNPLGDWNQEFSRSVLPNPSLFKDKVIILSTKPYSNLPAESLGLLEDVWQSFSYAIRLHHECSHLYTLKRYGCASNNLHDELIADYVGICKTIGHFNKDWILSFMGLENYPQYRKGARLENYLGDTNLTMSNFGQLIRIIKNAIENIAIFDAEIGKKTSDNDLKNRIESLCETDVLNIASQNGAYLLIEKYNHKKIVNG